MYYGYDEGMARMARGWEVWNVDLGSGNAVAVDQGTEAAARAGAESRNASAVRANMLATAFIALPLGTAPDYYDLQNLRESRAAVSRAGAAPAAAAARTLLPGEHEYEFTLVITMAGRDEAEARMKLGRNVLVSHEVKQVRPASKGGTS